MTVPKQPMAPSARVGARAGAWASACALACAVACGSGGGAPSAGVSAAPQGAAASEDAKALRVTGMTFVGSRGTARELVLRSDRAVFHPDTDIAELETVHAVVTDDEDGESFEMTCDTAELNVETNDFVARGNVEGVTADGQHYSAPVVHYDHDEGMLRSDSRVVMVDDSGSFEGDGFRYDVRDRTFRLLGNVKVVTVQ